jgi:hypothetical protein
MFATTLLGFTFDVIWGVIVLMVWIAIAFWPARVAARKGHSFLGYFIFSLFFFPLALLVAYLVPNRMGGGGPAPTAPAPSA